MPVEFFYSKKYSENGALVKTAGSADYFALSRVVLPNPPYVFGFKTYIATLNQLKNYAVADITANLGSFTVNGTLTGNGSQSNPIGINDATLNSIYVRTKSWPMTQVGDPAETTLPISGSYFSVSYPYYDMDSALSVFVEGNGDLRLLRKVTNGERFAVVYGVWKNYRQTPLDALTFTDVQYRPPGLSGSEYIYHTFNASDSAMLAIIADNSGFKDFAFIILNDTLIDTYHEIIRLGVNPLTELYGTTDLNYLGIISRTNINAIVVNDKKYISCILPSGWTVDGDSYACRLRIAEVSDLGEVTPLTGWTVTNSEGAVFTSTHPIINDVLYDSVENKGALFGVTDPRVHMEYEFGVSNMQWGGQKTNGKIPLSICHYFVVYTPAIYRDVKPIFYYDIDINARTITPSPGGTNRRWNIGVNEWGGPSWDQRSKTYNEGHYWASAYKLNLLNNGDRILNITGGNAGVNQEIYAIQGNSFSLDDVTNDVNFANEVYRGKSVYSFPPTPVGVTNIGQILHDKLRLIDIKGEAYSANSDTYKTLALLSGAPNARTYNLLGGGIFSARTPYPGYNLNNDRVVIPSQPSFLSVIRKYNVLHYHNAAWCDNEPSYDYQYSIDDQSVGNYVYRLGSVARSQMESFVSGAPIPSDWTNLHAVRWLIMPSYPGIGEDWVIIRIIVAFTRPDAGSSIGIAQSGPYDIIRMIPANITIDSIGTATINSLNFTGIDYTYNTNHNGGSGIYLASVQNSRACISVECDADGWRMIQQGGPSADNYMGGGTTQPAWPIALKFDLSRNLIFQKNEIANYNWCATINPLAGLGHVTHIGLGALYAFVPWDFNTGYHNTSAITVLGSARPADGFNYTVSAPIDVYVDGKAYVIPVQTVNLTSISSSYQNTYFYCYAQIFNGVATLVTSKSKLEEHINNIYLGYIKTTTTEIEEINCRPVTRWEIARVSPAPIGSSIGSSIGTPASTTGTVWESAAPLGGTGTEYLWGGDDIVDTDDRS